MCTWTWEAFAVIPMVGSKAGLHGDPAPSSTLPQSFTDNSYFSSSETREDGPQLKHKSPYCPLLCAPGGFWPKLPQGQDAGFGTSVSPSLPVCSIMRKPWPRAQVYQVQAGATGPQRLHLWVPVRGR